MPKIPFATAFWPGTLSIFLSVPRISQCILTLAECNYFLKYVLLPCYISSNTSSFLCPIPGMRLNRPMSHITCFFGCWSSGTWQVHFVLNILSVMLLSSSLVVTSVVRHFHYLQLLSNFMHKWSVEIITTLCRMVQLIVLHRKALDFQYAYVLIKHLSKTVPAF